MSIKGSAHDGWPHVGCSVATMRRSVSCDAGNIKHSVFSGQGCTDTDVGIERQLLLLSVKGGLDA